MDERDEVASKKCPFCAEDIQRDAVKCKHCGEWLDKTAYRPDTTHPVAQQYSNAQAPWQLVLLSIMSFGIYEIYWFYRNWKHLRDHKNFRISPGWRTVGLLVPILNILLTYDQFRDIKAAAADEHHAPSYSPGWITFGYVLLCGISFRLALQEWAVEDALVLLGLTVAGLVVDLLAVGLLVIVQSALNDLWAREQPQPRMRTHLSGGEIAIVVIGGIMWLLSLIGTLAPA